MTLFLDRLETKRVMWSQHRLMANMQIRSRQLRLSVSVQRVLFERPEARIVDGRFTLTDLWMPVSLDHGRPINVVVVSVSAHPRPPTFQLLGQGCIDVLQAPWIQLDKAKILGAKTWETYMHSLGERRRPVASPATGLKSVVENGVTFTFILGRRKCSNAVLALCNQYSMAG